MGVQLHILAEQSQRSFDMQRHIIRSNSLHSDHLFAFYKPANQLDDPPRTRVRSLPQSAIQFRQLPLPPTPRPLVLPLLCHPTFKSQTRAWLRQLAIQHKPWLPPFHIPKCNITVDIADFRWMKQFLCSCRMASCSMTERLCSSGLLCVQNPVSKGLQLTMRNQRFSASFD